MSKRRISNADFCHIHNHTEYSKFDGLNKVPEFVKLARTMGFPALGITDHGTVGGLIKFMQQCKAPMSDDDGNELPPIKPLLGCEFYLAKNRFEKQPEGRKGNRHILLIAKNWEGYQNLCALSQHSFVEGRYYDPRIDYDLLQKYHKGLICSSACLSSVVNANLLADRYDQAKKAVSLFKDLFGRDFFLEVMYHGIDAEGAIIPDILKLGKEMECPVCASNDCHYGCKHHGASQEVLMAMSSSKCIKDPKHLHFPYHEFYLKSASEMAVSFGSHPELLLNTMKIAERVDSDDIDKHLGGMRLPKFDLPEGFTDPYDYLCHLAWEGMKRLGWDQSQPHIDRLKVELNDVKVAKESNNYDFATYFLIVRDYIDYANNSGILTGCGRGSGYGSVLLRTIDIAYGPDPIEYGLLWERFLGFDDKYFITPDDFGFSDVEIEETHEHADVLEEREDEEDQGGVDRY